MLGATKEVNEIRICDLHQKTYKVPMLWTFAIPSCERWCPFCGHAGGMLGTGTDVPMTKELDRRHAFYAESSREYLQMLGRKSCHSLVYEGKEIKYADLPQEEKDRGDKIIEAWKKNARVPKEYVTPNRLPKHLCKECGGKMSSGKTLRTFYCHKDGCKMKYKDVEIIVAHLLEEILLLGRFERTSCNVPTFKVSDTTKDIKEVTCEDCQEAHNKK